jgi:hypothetical protein
MNLHTFLSHVFSIASLSVNDLLHDVIIADFLDSTRGVTYRVHSVASHYAVFSFLLQVPPSWAQISTSALCSGTPSASHLLR